jgi:hypothetical protein
MSIGPARVYSVTGGGPAVRMAYIATPNSRKERSRSGADRSRLTARDARDDVAVSCDRAFVKKIEFFRNENADRSKTGSDTTKHSSHEGSSIRRPSPPVARCEARPQGDAENDELRDIDRRQIL